MKICLQQKQHRFVYKIYSSYELSFGVGVVAAQCALNGILHWHFSAFDCCYWEENTQQKCVMKAATNRTVALKLWTYLQIYATIFYFRHIKYHFSASTSLLSENANKNFVGSFRILLELQTNKRNGIYAAMHSIFLLSVFDQYRCVLPGVLCVYDATKNAKPV